MVLALVDLSGNEAEAIRGRRAPGVQMTTTLEATMLTREERRFGRRNIQAVPPCRLGGFRP
jgi:hypothetical protein